jgi:uncharacterized HAD superfamily protein
MTAGPLGPVDPGMLAFDIDGVVADTMEIFVRLAHERYGLSHISKEDLLSYNLYECLDLKREIIDDLIRLTLEDEHTMEIPPVPGAPAARIRPESITQWLITVLPDVPREKITVVASGAPEIKLGILNELEIRYFVEDRVETCRQLKKAGIQPFLFVQPWNRNEAAEGFIRVENWGQLKEWVLPSGKHLG